MQLETEPPPPGYQRLLRPMMRQGRVIPGSLPPLSEIWELAQANLRALPERYHALKAPNRIPCASAKLCVRCAWRRFARCPRARTAQMWRRLQA